MSIKLIGTIIVIAGCGGFGFRLAASCRREERELRQLLSVLDQIQCELEYRLTPLPELCRLAGEVSSGNLHRFFSLLSSELEQQIAPDARCCMNAAISQSDLCRTAKQLLYDLGKTLGRFDLPGQLRGIEAIRREGKLALDKLTSNQDVRLRSYQTLGLCAGAALAILLL